MSDNKKLAGMDAGVKHLQQYIEYIHNTGRIPLPLAIFDDDWEPIGPNVRKQLVDAELVQEREGGLYIL